MNDSTLIRLKNELRVNKNLLDYSTKFNIDFSKLKVGNEELDIPSTFYFYKYIDEFIIFVEVNFPMQGWDSELFLSRMSVDNKKGFQISEYGAEVGIHTFICNDFKNLDYLRSDYYNTFTK